MHPRTIGQALQKDLTESAMVLPTARDTQSVQRFLVVEDIGVQKLDILIESYTSLIPSGFLWVSHVFFLEKL